MGSKFPLNSKPNIADITVNHFTYEWLNLYLECRKSVKTKVEHIDLHKQHTFITIKESMVTYCSPIKPIVHLSIFTAVFIIFQWNSQASSMQLLHRSALYDTTWWILSVVYMCVYMGASMVNSSICFIS